MTAYLPACSSGGLRLGEPPPEPLNEAELSWIWAGQRFPAEALQLVDGRRLRVVSPGRPGGGAGPDFLDASFEIDGRPVRGDVELHVRGSGFRAHGHHTDPAYDRLALHVVFRADDGAATRLSNGGLAPVAAFAPWLDGRTQELQGWLTAEALWREPCRDAVARLGEAAVRAVLRTAGLLRFEAKVAALRASADEAGEAEALWRALLDALGVGGDRPGFRRLAAAFPERLANAVAASAPAGEAAERLLAALVRVAGLGGASEPEGPALPPPLRPPIGAPGRPANRPERRLAGLAALYARSAGDAPSSSGRSPSSGSGHSPSSGSGHSPSSGSGRGPSSGSGRGPSSGSGRGPSSGSGHSPSSGSGHSRSSGSGHSPSSGSGRGLPALVRADVASAESPRRLVTAWQAARRGEALVGAERARELVLNVVLPFAAADPSLRPRALELLDGVAAAAPYGKTAFLEANLRTAGGRRLVRTALEQQGILSFLGEWCSQGGCGRCPLS